MNKIIVVIFCFVFMSFGIVAASLETQSPRSEPNFLIRGVTALPLPTLIPSTLHSHYFLHDCSILLLERRALILQGVLDAEYLACGAMAEDIARSRPTQGLAWLILGFAAELEGSTEKAKTALTISQALNPNERFLAQQRMALHQLLLTDTNQAPIAGFWQDAKYAATSNNGRQRIASLYLRNPQVRNQFDAFLEQQPDRTAEAILREIERVLEGEGN